MKEIKKTVIALGFFDGVHTAHQHLLNAAAAEAARRGMEAIAVTFDRHPRAVILGKQPELLCTAEERCTYIKETSRIGRVEQLVFDEALMNTEPEDFIRNLAERFSPGAVFAGADYTFGKGGRGNAALLREIASEMGIDCHIIELETVNGEKISSSVIRERIRDGQAAEAARLLGRGYSFSGVIQHGKALGRTLGFRTINVPIPEELVLPKAGVYVCRVTVNGGTYNAVCNVAHGEKPLCEANIFDFSQDVYGRTAKIELLEMLREMKNFENLEKLREQVEIDKEIARNWFKKKI